MDSVMTVFKEMYQDFTSAFSKEEFEILKVVFFMTLGFIIIAANTSLMTAISVFMIVWANNLALRIK